MVDDRYLLVLSDEDPVAAAIRPLLGPPGEVEFSGNGIVVRRYRPGVLVVHRPGHHIFDDRLDVRLPEKWRTAGLPLVFPSVHRSARGVRCFTVHALGNLGRGAELGGESGWVTPSAPRLMASAVRTLDELGRSLGLRATYEATHHGPALGQPALFVEIGFADDPSPPTEAVHALARALGSFSEDSSDRIAVGVGGGHYAPHFTDLSLDRRWAFGHIVPKHAIQSAPAERLRLAYDRTPGAEGILLHRAADAALVPEGLPVPRLAEASAPRRRER